MNKFIRQLITEWRRLGLPFDDAAVVIGVSGGADSISLLLALEELVRRGKLGVRVVAAHFDHGLRGAESDADAEFVRELTAELGVEADIGKGRVKRTGNLEQNARVARYAFLQDIALKHGAGIVLTAHTMNDQAETLLMNLLRGSGADGLSGMTPSRKLESRQISLVRPLLRWAKRVDTEEYCRFRRVEFRQDAMNEDAAFTRVRVRKELLPMMATFNPKIVETLARTAELVGAGSASEGTKADDELLIRKLKELSKEEQLATIRAWLVHHRGNSRRLALKHIDAIARLVRSEKSGRVVELPGNATVIKSSGRLVYAPIKVDK